MVCPKCSSTETQVTNSRRFTRKQQVWRRRLCDSCGFGFTTRESLDLTYLTVAKKDGQTEPFSSAKHLVSVAKACDHLSGYQTAAAALHETVLTKLLPLTSGRLSSSQIAKVTMDVLKRFNAAAFLKYASYQTDLVSNRQVRSALRAELGDGRRETGDGN